MFSWLGAAVAKEHMALQQPGCEEDTEGTQENKIRPENEFGLEGTFRECMMLANFIIRTGHAKGRMGYVQAEMEYTEEGEGCIE